MPKFIAYAVDISGTALARYCTDKEAAERESQQYLEHPVIEVWFDDHRRVARIVRKSASGAAKMEVPVWTSGQISTGTRIIFCAVE